MNDDLRRRRAHLSQLQAELERQRSIFARLMAQLERAAAEGSRIVAPEPSRLEELTFTPPEEAPRAHPYNALRG